MVFNYPTARKQDLVEKIHGIDIPSPYRWTEDPDSDETKYFANEQQKLTESYLKGKLFKKNLVFKNFTYISISKMHRIERKSNRVYRTCGTMRNLVVHLRSATSITTLEIVA